MEDKISRRGFLKTGIAIGAATYGLSLLSSRDRPRKLKEFKKNDLEDSLVVARGKSNSHPGDLTYKAIETLGGMGKLVSPGDVIVIKPNIAWERPPELAANTNPHVVAALVKMCLDAGAKEVKVIDHTISPNPGPAYKLSGIADAASKAGAKVLKIERDRFVELPIPDDPQGRFSKVLKSWEFYDEFVYADKVDVLINCPAAKHHSTSRLSMGLKNVFGMVGKDRGTLHEDIHRKIADLNKVVKIDLTVLDAYRILTAHGPSGNSLADVDNSTEHARRVVASIDRVAVDAYGATLFGLEGRNIGFIKESHNARLGNMDFESRLVESVK